MRAKVICEAELVLDAGATTGETPTWSQQERRLYWIDVEEPALHRFDPSTGIDERWETPGQIGAFALCEDGAVILALRAGLFEFRPESGACVSLCGPPYNPFTHRFNDGKVDRDGRFWIGVMHDPLNGAAPAPAAWPLQVYVAGEGLRGTEISAVIANGLAMSPDMRTLYFSDTAAARVTAFDLDIDAGALSRPRLFASFEDVKGKPDGAAVDVEGAYWCALYGGGRVARLSPDGEVLGEVLLPVSQPTMCAFGAEDDGALYVTTAAKGLSRIEEPLAGGIFRCRPGVRGLPNFLFGKGEA